MTNSPPHHHARSALWRDPDELYTGRRPAWDIGRPQPAFLALADAGEIRGRVLDVGCGTGEHVLLCAAAAWTRPASTSPPPHSPPPGAKADQRGASPRGSYATTPAGSPTSPSRSTPCSTAACSTSSTTPTAPPSSPACARRSAGRPLPHVVLQRRPAGRQRPHRVTHDEIVTAFRQGWRVDSIEPATIETLTDPDGIRAWLAAFTRT